MSLTIAQVQSICCWLRRAVNSPAAVSVSLWRTTVFQNSSTPVFSIALMVSTGGIHSASCG